ncbi:ribokinase [Arthrobacter dokdonensis]|uniref:ribokinase n=1 Tax=Arthrobacter dokdonellae TaxID=2211210 RepID=UPI001D130B1F|nr:ribokinase [Arthrobacter dokdonellae]
MPSNERTAEPPCKVAPDITVIASINIDWTVSSPRIPGVGETIIGDKLARSWGGKGANQAVAAARLGNSVRMVGGVGDDDLGQSYIRQLNGEGIDTESIARFPDEPTGLAFITVAHGGANSIIVIPGANHSVREEHIRTALERGFGGVVLGQLELPIATTTASFQRARAAGAVTVLNPAPACSNVDELLLVSDIVVPNEVEFEQITGHKATSDAELSAGSQFFFDRGASWVVVTLGDRGTALVRPAGIDYVAAHKVSAVDTTAAGDSFIGGLVHSLATEAKIGRESMLCACEFGTKVAAWSVQRVGAQSSLPRAIDLAQTT